MVASPVPNWSDLDTFCRLKLSCVRDISRTWSWWFPSGMLPCKSSEALWRRFVLGTSLFLKASSFLANFVQFFRRSLKLRQSFVATLANKYLATVRETAHIHIKGRFNNTLHVDWTFTKNVNFLCICWRRRASKAFRITVDNFLRGSAVHDLLESMFISSCSESLGFTRKNWRHSQFLDIWLVCSLDRRHKGKGMWFGCQ